MKTLRPFLWTLLALSALPGGALEIRTYTASELGFLANSHLIVGEEEAILVDAPFTRSQTQSVVRKVRESGRRLATIFITCPRPEHFLGLPILAAEFPEARIVARPATAAQIAEGGQAAIDHWRPIYVDDLPATVVVPEALEEVALHLDGQVIEIHELDEDAALPAALYIPSEKTLLASDLVFGGVHPFLGATPPAVWLRGLQALVERLGEVRWVYPGHGTGGGATLLDEAVRYLETLDRVWAPRSDRSVTVGRMQEAFPGYRMPILLERGLREAALASRF